jgi:Rrf2 family protein
VKLSTRGDYGVRVVLELARAGDGATLSAADLAARCSVPANYLAHLLADLKTRDIVRSVRGAHGGFSLGRAAGQITVGDVVRVMDGPLAPIPCASTLAHIPCPANRCPDENACTLRGLWLEVRNAIADVVDRVTFADLAARERPGVEAPGAYSI